MNVLDKIFYKQDSKSGTTLDVGVDFDHVFMTDANAKRTITLQQWFDFMKKNLKKVSSVLNDPLNNTPKDNHVLWVDYSGN